MKYKYIFKDNQERRMHKTQPLMFQYILFHTPESKQLPTFIRVPFNLSHTD